MDNVGPTVLTDTMKILMFVLLAMQVVMNVLGQHRTNVLNATLDMFFMRTLV